MQLMPASRAERRWLMRWGNGPVPGVDISFARTFCKSPQARVLWVGMEDRKFEGQIRSVPEWPQEAQKLQSAGLYSHSGIRVHRGWFSVERPQKAQKRDGASLEPYFVPFVLFVVEPFTPLAGQREPFLEKPGERSLAGQNPSLLSHGDARFRIMQKARLFVDVRHGLAAKPTYFNSPSRASIFRSPSKASTVRCRSSSVCTPETRPPGQGRRSTPL